MNLLRHSEQDWALMSVAEQASYVHRLEADLHQVHLNYHHMTDEVGSLRQQLEGAVSDLEQAREALDRYFSGYGVVGNVREPLDRAFATLRGQ
jgi:hypothetical protein